MKKRFMLFVVCLLLLTGCGKLQETEQEEEKQDATPAQIGLVFDSFVIERWQKDRDVFVSTAKEYGAEVNVQNANGDIDTQISQIRYLIKKKVDVLVVVCIDSDGLADVIAEAEDAGIRVIAYDRMIKNANVDLYISFDNEKVGTLMGQALVQAGLPNKKVLMLSGPTADNNVSQVEKGFQAVMDENDIEIVGSMHADGWKAEFAYDYINEHPELLDGLDAIMCGNDGIATSTVRALAEKRLASKIRIVGQDAELEACQRIVEGTQVMTVYKPVEKQAQAAAVYACQLARGEGVQTDRKAYDGTYDVPAVVLEPIAVNADNMQEVIINSGFHLKEEVYLNVRD